MPNESTRLPWKAGRACSLELLSSLPMPSVPLIFDPGHPDANEDGYVAMPNVTLPHEMVDLVTSSRAYEANLKSMETFRQMAEQALQLLQGIR